MRLHRRLLAALVGGALAWSAAPAKADPAVTGVAIAGVAQLLAGVIFNPQMPDADREFVMGGAGIFDVVDDEDRAALFNVEYWAPVTFYRIRPIAGLIGTSDRAIGGYVGLQHEFNLGRHVVVAANVSAVGADWGDGKDLGSSVVLRSGIEVGYRFDSGAQVLGGFHHMSHGKVFDDINPGTETVTLAISVPTDALFGGQLFRGKHYWPKLLGW